MRKLASSLAMLAVGLLAAPALAGQTSWTFLNGTVTPLGGNGDVMGYGWTDGGNVPTGGPNKLYDNMGTVFGGNATGGGTFNGLPLSWVYLRWGNNVAQYGDDLHRISKGGPGPAVITSIRYIAFPTGTLPNAFGVPTVGHTIKIYNMLEPSGTFGGVTTPIEKGTLLTSIRLTGLPAGAPVQITVAGLSLVLPSSSVWIKFGDLQGVNALTTFWATGGVPRIGNSTGGINYSYKVPGGPVYNYYIPGPFGPFGSPPIYALGNVNVSLGGFHIPGPAVISLLGIGGLAALRRRRVRAA